jgi:Ala-tRNA(Pro) deacylase
MKDYEYKEKIFDYLNENNIQFDTDFEHIKAQGGKSILFKDKRSFSIFTLRADKEIDNKKVRKILNSQKLRFATADELMEVAGVISGALPPFGRPFIDIDHYLDKSILESEYIAFNAAIKGHRIRLKLSDYLKAINPTLCDFKKI